MAFASKHIRRLLGRTRAAVATHSKRAISISPAFYGARDMSSSVFGLKGSRKMFVFQDGSRRHDDVIAFYGKTGNVHPLAFAAAIKDMKALLHNA